jgi:N-sulfoglucosamine sulfohydrolase
LKVGRIGSILRNTNVEDRAGPPYRSQHPSKLRDIYPERIKNDSVAGGVIFPIVSHLPNPMKNPKHYPAFLISLFTIALLATTIRSLSADEKLNVLLITADDLGIQLSCYGDPIANTPHIDALAAKSVRFKTAYVSQASCSPSRSTMFTGLYPHGNGHYGLANANVGFRVHEQLIDDLLPNALKRAGYRTGIIGKLHVDPEERFQFDFRTNEGFGARDIRKQIQFARDYLDTDSQDPWFLMFNVFDPHVQRDRLPDGSRSPQYLPDQVQGLPKELVTVDEIGPWPWQGIDTPEQRVKIAGYYNCVHRVDIAVGMLMELLEEKGQSENTLIIFLGDHGPPFTRGKTSCYEAGLRVPFIAHWPGVSQPHVSERLVGSIDIYPTILDAVGIDRPSNLHGRSLRPVLRENSSARWRDTLVAEFHYHGASPFFPRRATTDGRYKLIYNILGGQSQASNMVDGDQAWNLAQELPTSHPARQAMDRLANPPKWELYDLEEDPVEFHNRAGESSLREVESRLKTALAKWQRETDDPFDDPDFRRQVQEKHRAGD